MIQNMKKLFSAALTGKRLIMSIVSVLLLVGVASVAAYELTKTHVTIVIDGEEKALKTHAKTVDELMLENDILVGEHDFIEPSLETELTNEVKVVWKPAILVYVTNNGEKSPVWTTKSTISELLDEINIQVGDYDLLEPSLETKLSEDLQVTFESAFSVVLNSDGEEREVWTTSTTVADFLEAEEIVLGELDRVEPNQEQFVKASTEINVIRVKKVTDVVEQATNFATVTRNDNSLLTGNEREVQKGQEGKIAKHYEVILENGKEVSRELIKTETVKESKDRIVAIGTKSPPPPPPPVSRSGTPGEWRTFEATAYTAYCPGCSGITSTGLNLRTNPNKNVVAVDPNVIPLGSIVEVRHNGRSLGQFKAADTGGAIQGRKIDIFMESRSAALRFGRQNVQVRIIR